MTGRRWIGLGLVLVLVVGAGGLWYAFFRDDAPERVSLQGALGGGSTTTATSLPDGGTTAPAPDTTVAPTTVAPTTVPVVDVDGVWGIDPGAGSFVGYRVREELSGIGAATAVGRTSEVEAVLEVSGTLVSRLDVTADLTALESDSGQRDGQLRSRGLETNDFPTATFVLTEPIELGSVPPVGEPIAASAFGELTLHGVTRPVEVPVEAQRTETQIVVVGSLPIFLPDYDIEAPTGFRVLSIDDNAEMEFQLLFGRS